MTKPTLENRISLQQRPADRSPVMHQRWEKLLFLHWEIDPGVIERSLPKGLHVDSFDGKAFIGLVPFFMRRIRPRGLPSVPYLSNFLECNVRTYVHDDHSRDRLYRGQVHHRPYHYADAGLRAWDPAPIVWNGLPTPAGEPMHACVAAPVDVSVFAIQA